MGTLPKEDYWQESTCKDKEGGWSRGKQFPAGPWVHVETSMPRTLQNSLSSLLPSLYLPFHKITFSPRIILVNVMNTAGRGWSPWYTITKANSLLIVPASGLAWPSVFFFPYGDGMSGLPSCPRQNGFLTVLHTYPSCSCLEAFALAVSPFGNKCSHFRLCNCSCMSGLL